MTPPRVFNHKSSTSDPRAWGIWQISMNKEMLKAIRAIFLTDERFYKSGTKKPIGINMPILPRKLMIK